MMIKAVFTKADYEAQMLYYKLGDFNTTSSKFNSPTDSGNKIIALAEKIKAERSVISMQDKL